MAPIEEIAQWIQNKTVWWRQSVRPALRHGELNQNCLDEILHVARMENGLEDQDVNYLYYSSGIDFSGYKSEQHEVSLHYYEQFHPIWDWKNLDINIQLNRMPPSEGC